MDFPSFMNNDVRDRDRSLFVVVVIVMLTIFLGGAMSCAAKSPPSPSPPHAEATAAPEAPTFVDAGSVSSTTTSSPTDAGVVDSGPHKIVWKWNGTYGFRDCDELGCTQYRLVIGPCPGACKVQIDVDGPKITRRLEGKGRGGADEYQLDVGFTGYGSKDMSKSGFTEADLLVTLEFLPGDHAMLHFRKLESSTKVAALLTTYRPTH
jgi:hypothetical protein